MPGDPPSVDCPHCGGSYDHRKDRGVKAHVCADQDRWTQAERDQWLTQTRERSPASLFAPSSRSMAERFGGR